MLIHLTAGFGLEHDGGTVHLDTHASYEKRLHPRYTHNDKVIHHSSRRREPSRRVVGGQMGWASNAPACGGEGEVVLS